MKLSKLSSLALGLTIVISTAIPAKANILEILQYKRHHLQRHSQVDRHHHEDNHHANYHNRRGNYHRVIRRRNGDRNRSRIRVYNNRRRYGRHYNWQGRH